MFNLFKRDHFILGYEENDILYIKSDNRIVFDTRIRLGYDSSKDIDEQNNLLSHHEKTKTALFMPLRKNKWRSPLFTLVSASALSEAEVQHLYRFCELMGGINITISQVSSVRAFLEKPSLSLVRKNYYR